MINRILITVGAALFLSTHGTRAPGLVQQPDFRSAIDLVTVDVAVHNGLLPVADLVANDFNVLDNGARQQIETLSTEAVPIDVSLILDTSSSAVGAIDRMKLDTQTIANMLRPIDRVRLVAFAKDVREIFPMQTPSPRLPLEALKAEGGTSLNDAMLYALSWPGAAGRRHLIVVCTDGEDSNSVLDDTAVLRMAERGGAVLHAVLFKPSISDMERHLNLAPRPPKASRAALIDAAIRTGGEAHEINNAVDAFRQIFDDFRHSYVIRYTLRDVKRDGWHEIAVSVVKPGGEKYVIRARKGYFGS